MPKFDSSSIKAGTESTAGDVPIWKQNQIQKKRVNLEILIKAKSLFFNKLQKLPVVLLRKSNLTSGNSILALRNPFCKKSRVDPIVVNLPICSLIV